MPKIVDVEGRRRQIAHAAMEIFKRKGYRRANLGEVAAECGIGRTTLYEYFSSKEALIEHAVRSTLMAAIAEVEDIARDTSLTWRQKLQVFVRSTMERFLSDPAQVLVTLEYWLDLYGSRLASREKGLTSHLGEAAAQLEEQLVKMFRSGIGANELSIRRTRGLAFLTHSLVISFCLQSALNPEVTLDRSVDMLDLFLDSWVRSTA